MLKNLLYTGYMEVDTTTYDKKTGRKLREWKVPFMKAKHKGIISLNTYHKIQERLDSKHRPTIEGIIEEHPDFPLRGFLVCEASGQYMTGSYSKGRSKSYPYYRFGHTSERKGKSIRAEKLHYEFETMLASMKPRKETIRLVAQEVFRLMEE